MFPAGNSLKKLIMTHCRVTSLAQLYVSMEDRKLQLITTLLLQLELTNLLKRISKEFQKRNVPVAVYSYALGRSTKEMKEEARTFYKNAAPYNPTYYWIDVEEATMKDMNKGVTAFREELKNLVLKMLVSILALILWQNKIFQQKVSMLYGFRLMVVILAIMRLLLIQP